MIIRLQAARLRHADHTEPGERYRAPIRSRLGAHRVRARRRIGVAMVLGALACSPGARADCFDAAAAYQGVSAPVLKAIAWVESHGNPEAMHRNANGSVDIGELQINSTHLQELSTYGINAQALRDECVNIYVAAWHLKKQIVKYGNTWAAVGAYHSATPSLRDAYAGLIRATLARWDATGVIGLPTARRSTAQLTAAGAPTDIDTRLRAAATRVAARADGRAHLRAATEVADATRALESEWTEADSQ
jgi:soluble lytic murein transglycosylase-like protein